MSAAIYEELDAFCDKVLPNNEHMDGVMAWIRDAAPTVFGNAFRDAYRRAYGFCITQKELRRVTALGRMVGTDLQTYAAESHTVEQITVWAKALIRRQLDAHEDEDSD